MADLSAVRSASLAALFTQSASGMAIVDGHGRILDANAAFLKCLGYAGGEALPPLEDLAWPADRAAIGHATNAARRADRPQTPWELRLRHADGRAFWVLLSIAFLPCPEEEGRDDTALFCVQIVDIDERKRNELDLSERESRWNHALESAGQGVWDHDYARGTMFYSREWRTMRGIRPDEVVDVSLENWIKSVHPEDRERVIAEIRKQEAAEAVFSMFSYRERHRDGRWIWIESRGAVVEYAADGRPSRIAGTDTDITERKQAEELLAQVSRRLELALEVSRIGVFDANLRTGELKWDSRMWEIYGKVPIESGSPSWEDTLHPDDKARAAAVVDRAVVRREPFSNKFRIIRENGEIRHIRARGAPYADTNGVPKLVGVNWDVTEDIRLQEELQHAKTLAEARNGELEAARARIEYTALHDHLTGLPNRRFLDATLEAAATEAALTGTRIAMLHIDLDRFKEINDTLGHRAGDRMLVHAAEVLKAHADEGDFVARIGGDEFVFLSRATGGRNLADLAERIVAAMRQPVVFEGHVCRFGASIGIASQAGEAIDAMQLPINADLALYRAKSKGRSRHEFFTSDIQAEIIVSKQTADEILCGIEQGRFLPWYQPQFDARTLDLVGVETLARWDHPVRGILTPDAFLKIAEDLNVVATIDRLVLEVALADFARWSQAGVGIPKISANVSSRRLHDPDLARSLRDLEFPPHALSFELLESIFLDDCDRTVLENLEEMRRLGIDIEIDDFGTGHASIISLLKLSPKRLKIDRQLVKPIDRSPGQRKLVGSIIEIGRSLNIEVVAEGVETAAHALILRELGCDILQGYALARPMPADAIGDFVRRQAWREKIHPVHALQDKLHRSVSR